MTRSTASHAFLLTFSMIAFSCGGGSEEANAADDADESASVTTSESALTTEMSDEVTQPVSMSAADVAQAASTRVGSHMQPPGCLTTAVNGATVTYTMNDCTGPYGLVHVTGTITAVYSRAGDGAIQVALTGTGIKANKSTLDINATVKASQSNGVRTANVTCNSSGTGPRGNTVSREGTYTVTYDSTAQCITVNGTWNTSAGVRSASTVVTNYKRCKGFCPAAGGTIAHTNARSTTITVSYDGSATAQWATSGGRSGTVSLVCTAN